jgi:hypothetical protein
MTLSSTQIGINQNQIDHLDKKIGFDKKCIKGLIDSSGTWLSKTW